MATPIMQIIVIQWPQYIDTNNPNKLILADLPKAASLIKQG